ncbi:MAG: cytosine deaminase, partial [Boseongicola sp.]
MSFRALPSGTKMTFANLTVPACLVDKPGDLTSLELTIENGRISGGRADEVIDMQRAMVFPCFVDMHTHLDKGHIWPRAQNPDGTFLGALETVGSDRAANWSADDVRARMQFGLECAYAHGSRAVRTHLDSIPPQDSISWPVFAELRDEWEGRISLQASSLIGCDTFENIATDYAPTADLVASHGGLLGLVTYPVPDLRKRLVEFFELAGNRGLDVDLHTDETMDGSSEALRLIAEIVMEIGWKLPVTVGHCCSLATQDNARAMETLDLAAKAGLNVVSLPMCNLYLQDRLSGRTPRNRGITLVHEMKARGINVSFASDNTRDPFFAYGDLDMIEVMRQATRIAQLDHSDDDWVHAFLRNPAEACGFDTSSLAPGAPADLVICSARDWTELFSRPQADRIVLRKGKQIDTSLPGYEVLDHLMEAQL